MSLAPQRPGPVAPEDEVERHRMPLIDHLKELRVRMLWCIGAVVAGMAVGLAFAHDIYDFLRAPIMVIFNEQPKNRWDVLYLQMTEPIRTLLPPVHVDGSLNNSSSPLEGMYAWLQIGVISGVVLASPVIAWHVWRFVAPGLYPTEKRVVVPLAMSSTVLFFAGAGFCYVVLFPVMFPFFLTQLDATSVISVQGYLEAVVRMMLGLGACFQLPVVVWFLARAGLIDHRDMIAFFRYAIVVIVIVAAIVTPTPDPLTQCLLSVPLVALYALGIVVARFASTKVRDPSLATT